MNERHISAGDGTPETAWLRWPGLQALPVICIEELVPAASRAVMVAPHPDDEVLGTGGLLTLLARNGRESRVIAVTDGDASHPGSTAWPRARLLRERRIESQHALRKLGLSDANEVTDRLMLPDGEVSAHVASLTARLVTLCRPSDLLITTWRLDGHPDHEATGRAVADAAAQVGCRLIEVPIWAWHWSVPGDHRLPWWRGRRVLLDAEAARRKRDAVRCFSSQLNVDPTTDRPPILRASTLARAERSFEVFFA